MTFVSPCSLLPSLLPLLLILCFPFQAVVVVVICTELTQSLVDFSLYDIVECHSSLRLVQKRRTAYRLETWVFPTNGEGSYLCRSTHKFPSYLGSTGFPCTPSLYSVKGRVEDPHGLTVATVIIYVIIQVLTIHIVYALTDSRRKFSMTEKPLCFVIRIVTQILFFGLHRWMDVQGLRKPPVHSFPRLSSKFTSSSPLIGGREEYQQLVPPEFLLSSEQTVKSGRSHQGRE